ncbi:MAG: crosslink repair DNA glycosylase YcaQ family protein [Candidatus Methanofastidiosia archaeon]|jgi:uncharacterized protein YcaQ
MNVSPQDARCVLFKTNRFLHQQKGITGTLDILKKHQCVQSDPIEVAGRNADLTIQSRVSDYNQDYLYSLLYEKRVAFEYYCKMLSILPIEKYPYFELMRTRQKERHAPFFKEHKKETALIVKMLEDGPVCSRDIKGWKKVEWWGSTALSRVILERLMVTGRAMIHHREGATKYYALTEDVIPEKYGEGYDNEICIKEMVKIIVNASRLVSPSRAPEMWYSIGKTKKVRTLLKTLEDEGDIFSLKLDGFRGKVYVPIEDIDIWEDPPDSDMDCVRFLAPLDPLNWNRALFKAIYNIEYAWEVYKKAEDRKYGYYCLPVLFNENCVGLIEPYYRKEDKTLEIRSFYILNTNIDHKKFKNALETEIHRFATNLGAETLEMNQNAQIKDITVEL